MKIQLEQINTDNKSSFRLLHNPRLNDLFYWHFHPEYELVYIEGANGTRHVGDHISQYVYSDLVLIGSNIPHLNFDYGIQTEYKKEVLHVSSAFKNKIFTEIPELSDVFKLFEKSQYGMAFTGKTKEIIGSRLKKLHVLSPFSQFLEVLHIFSILASSEEYTLLHEYPVRNKYSQKQQDRLKTIYAFIDKNYQRKIELAEVAALSNLSKEAFCRYFKAATGSPFTSFLNRYRISQAKRLLLKGKNISEACYDCGYESLSYFNRTFRKITSENPSDFKRRYMKSV
ncbi:AraC family transcriptional regulator [uncultured Eudoraea sp.]|uniref:AraC family transcriptional regulator n=1 Tax=uncultured Eudoraea sp. TaxID=1035614 RepID=UPI002612CFD3|nr:AraC family transcriptional regulator [uncultured Eudoraea sp.]